MPNLVDVPAIAEQIRTRIAHLEEQLKQHQNLTDELERLRDALGRLEGDVRARVSSRGRRSAKRAAPAKTKRAAKAKPAAKTATAAKPVATPKKAAARAPRGQNKAKVLEALKSGPMTASQISKQTGISAGTASTMLTKMAKAGEIVKATRGYELPR